MGVLDNIATKSSAKCQSDINILTPILAGSVLPQMLWWNFPNWLDKNNDVVDVIWYMF